MYLIRKGLGNDHALNDYFNNFGHDISYLQF